MKKFALMAVAIIVTVMILLSKNNYNETPTLDKEPSNQVEIYQPLSVQTLKGGVANNKKPVSKKQVNALNTQVIKDEVQHIANLYEENSRYPIGSQPIRNPNDVREFQPFEQSEVKLPFPSDENDKSPIYLSAATEKFQYFQGDIIKARLQILNAEPGSAYSVSGVISGGHGELPTTLNFKVDNDSSNVFETSFDTKAVSHELMSNEMLFKFLVSVNGRSLSTTVTFRYAHPSAEFISLSEVRPVGAELRIPLKYDVFESGYYFVSAVLEDAASSLPLIQLQNEGRLSKGESTLTLNAHIAALKSMGSEGPYRLRSINIYRGAEEHENFDSPGTYVKSGIKISQFPFSQYNDEPFVDSDAQERIQFLQELSESSDDKSS